VSQGECAGVFSSNLQDKQFGRAHRAPEILRQNRPAGRMAGGHE